MRGNLTEALSVLPRLEVVGEAQDGLEALQSIRRLKPDIITLDIRVPKLSGLGVLQALRKNRCQSKVIILSAMADEFYREKCRELGAPDFFDKITQFDQFVKLLKTL